MAASVIRRGICQKKKKRNKINDEPRNPHIIPRIFSTITRANMMIWDMIRGVVKTKGRLIGKFKMVVLIKRRVRK